MSTISAGLVKTTNLTVTGTQAGAVETTNLTAGSVTASSLATNDLSVGNTFSATNFFSTQQIAEDRWHLPTPVGPFAVDIIPMGIQNMNFVTDIIAPWSGKYWGTVPTYQDNMNVTIWAPSNRTGVAKNVSASLVGCYDPVSPIDTSNGGIYPKNTLVSGNCLFHPDDFVLNALYGGSGYYNGADDSSGSYVGWSEAITAFGNYLKATCKAYGGNNTIDSSAGVRTQLKTLYNVVRNTVTYKNLYRHFSVKTGKIWYNTQGVSLANGYKDFTMSRPTDNLLVGDSSCVLLNTTWTNAQLPTQQQIFQATGDGSGCPVIIKLNGTQCTEIGYTDPWHSAEMASRGYIVIVLGCAPYAYDPQYKIGTNQTMIDALFNGYLGDNTNFDFTNKLVFPTTFSNWTSNVNKLDYQNFTFSYNGTGDLGAGTTLNFNNVAQTNPWGVANAFNVNTGNALFYQDENGRTGNTDTCNIYQSMVYSNQVPRTDASGNVSWNNYKSWEKWLYAMKYVATFIGLTPRCNFANVSTSHFSAGGFFYPIIQNVLTSSTPGNTKRLVDLSSNPVYLFKIVSSVHVESSLIGRTVENQGIVYTNTTAPSTETATSYNYPQDNQFVWGSDNICSIPNGFTVPAFIHTITGPSLFLLTALFDRGVLPVHYALQKTRLNNSPVLNKSYVYYVGSKHYTAADEAYGPSAGTTDLEWNNLTPQYSWSYSGGWEWPVAEAFDSFLYPTANTSQYAGIPTIHSQVVNGDLSRTPMFVLWNIHTQGLDITTPNSGSYQANGVSLQMFMEYGNRDCGILVGGETGLANYKHIDGMYRYIGPHKIETLRDSSGRNHLSLDFGKSVLFENNNSQLEILARPGYNAQILVDGSGASISLNGVTLTAAKLTALLALVA